MLGEWTSRRACGNETSLLDGQRSAPPGTPVLAIATRGWGPLGGGARRALDLLLHGPGQIGDQPGMPALVGVKVCYQGVAVRTGVGTLVRIFHGFSLLSRGHTSTCWRGPGRPPTAGLPGR